MIEPMKVSELRYVVSVHLDSFPGFFLSFLGPAFLYHLYHGLASDETGIHFVYKKDQSIVGFVCGSSHPEGLYRRLIKKRWWAFALASLPAVLKNPGILSRLVRALKKPSEYAAGDHSATLMSIAVSPEHQGKGIGDALVKAFVSEAKQRGCGAINLTTDRLENDAVNHFYRKMGFELVRTFVTPEGRAMNEYELLIDQAIYA
ncbi:MAG: GNAT family N-acetyltransferase [Anaerolineae bacterium]|nr:GNAT family N-acetyltransferase [Anaerolineae bacterium]